MTREEALTQLGLSPSASKDDIEQAYRRMVRRYPPEFQPEKFRQVDEAYQSLISLPFLLEKLLAPEEIEAMRRRLDALIARAHFPHPGPDRHYPWPPI